jgi:hypothetical protein
VPQAAIHVVPDRGRWVVRHEGDERPASAHATATEAELAARSRARARGVPVIVLHDLYMRVRDAPVPLQ